MGSKYNPRQVENDRVRREEGRRKRRSHTAKGMIVAGTGQGGPMRDRRQRRPKEREDFRDLQREEEEWDNDPRFND